jgi:hypothetical protein
MKTLTFTPPLTLTLEQFAGLRSAWPYTDIGGVNGNPTLGGGMLLARIHPDNNRPEGDETVIARALVFVFPYKGHGDSDFYDEGHLGRLTIRSHNLMGSTVISQPDADEHDKRYDRFFRESYVETLRLVMKLPVIKLESEAREGEGRSVVVPAGL